MNELMYSFRDNDISIIEKDGQVWFKVKDVCEVLELSNPSMVISRLDKDEVTKFNLGGLVGETNFVNEYGIYNLIFGSRKPEAKEFKRWVTHEVLPTIRKHGMYATEDTLEQILNNPEAAIKTLTRLKEEQDKRKELEVSLLEAKPKVLLADSISSSESLILIRELASILTQSGYNIGEKGLFDKLRRDGYIIKDGFSRNSPTRKSIQLGILKLTEGTRTNGKGTFITKTTKVTGKGQQYFVNKFMKEAKPL